MVLTKVGNRHAFAAETRAFPLQAGEFYLGLGEFDGADYCVAIYNLFEFVNALCIAVSLLLESLELGTHGLLYYASFSSLLC